MQSFSDRKFKITFAAIWIFWFNIHTGVLINFGLPVTQALTDAVISNVLLAAGCWLSSNNMRYYLPGKERFLYILIVSIALTTIWFFATRFFLKLIFKYDDHYLLLLKASSSIRFSVAFLLSGCMAMMSLLWYSQKEQLQINSRKAEAEKLTREAELFKLRHQLQPHFLFNSLNSISALTGTQPEKARHMIQQLSDFLRGTLKRDEQQFTSLSEELEYLRLYLDIEKVRFGYRLQTEINCNDETLEMKLPALLLQPVAENAIKFGLYDTTGEVLITLSAIKNNGDLEITITNPFDADTAQPLRGTGFGLVAIKRRLFLLFARNDLLQTTTHNNQFQTTLIIPQLHEGNNN